MQKQMQTTRIDERPELNDNWEPEETLHRLCHGQTIYDDMTTATAKQ